MDIDFNNFVPELHYYVHRTCTPNWKIEPSIIPFIDITYVVSGKAEYTIGDEKYLVKKGDLLCIPKSSFRSAITYSDHLIESYAVNLFLYTKTGQDATLPIPVVNHVGMIPDLITNFHKIHEVWLQRNFGYMIKVQGILCTILYQIFNLLLNDNYYEHEDPRIKSSIKYMSMHYADPLTIESIATQFHLHPVYFGNLFRNTTGTTFKQYLLSLRLNYAEDMLKSGEYNVSQVAEQCGFSDIFYFSKLFKEKKGISPSKLFPTKYVKE